MFDVKYNNSDQYDVAGFKSITNARQRILGSFFAMVGDNDSSLTVQSTSNIDKTMF